MIVCQAVNQSLKIKGTNYTFDDPGFVDDQVHSLCPQ